MSAENLLPAVHMKHGIQMAKQQVKDSHPIPDCVGTSPKGEDKREKCVTVFLLERRQESLLVPLGRGDKRKETAFPDRCLKGGWVAEVEYIRKG